MRFRQILTPRRRVRLDLKKEIGVDDDNRDNDLDSGNDIDAFQ